MFCDIRAVTAKIDKKTDLTHQIYLRFTYLEPNISIKFSELLAVINASLTQKIKASVNYVPTSELVLPK